MDNYNPYGYYSPMGLNGHLVDNIEVVKNINIPVGGYGIFPKTDLTEIYVKSWNNNGTINIMTYKLTMNDASNINNSNEIDKINAKIDTLIEKLKPLWEE